MMFSFIGVYAKTYTYSDAVLKSSSYINRFAHYNEYIISNSNDFLTENEFEYAGSESGNLNYLVTGLEFWLKNSSNSCSYCKYVLNGIKSKSNSNSKSGTRVTELVRSEVKVTGIGTQTNPWEFVNQYRVVIGVNDQDMGSVIIAANGNNYAILEENDSVQFDIVSNSGYKYKSNNCKKGSYNNNVLKIENVTENISCIVNFEERRYNVSINNDGGNGESKVYLIYKNSWYSDGGFTNKISEITKPTKTGYTFKDYYIVSPKIVVTNANGKFTATDVAANTDDLEMMAEYTPNKYNVTFDVNGGNAWTTSTCVSPSSLSNNSCIKIVTYDSTYDTMPTPIRTGYTFAGWYTAATDGTAVTASTNVSTASDHMLYAHWTLNSYNISYVLGGGTLSNQTTSVKYNKKLSVSTPTKSIKVTYSVGSSGATAGATSETKSYTFNGWNITNMDTVKHYIGNTTSTETSLTGRKETSYKNLRSTSGTVTFTATWTAPTFTAPTLTRTGYTCKWTNTELGDLTPGSGKYTPSKGETSVTYSASCTINSYMVDVNPIINGTKKSSGQSGFTFNVYVNGKSVASKVTDWYQSVAYGSKVKVEANSVTNYNIQSYTNEAIVGINGLEFNPSWKKNTVNCYHGYDSCPENTYIGNESCGYCQCFLWLGTTACDKKGNCYYTSPYYYSYYGDVSECSKGKNKNGRCELYDQDSCPSGWTEF